MRFVDILEDDLDIYCKLFREIEIGDEFNYLFKCPFFIEERLKFLPVEILESPNNESLDQIGI